MAAAFVDSNVLIPYLSGEDADQLARAASVIETDEPRLLSITVLLETAWVLRRVNLYDAAAIAAAIHDVLGRGNVEVVELPTDLVRAMIGRWRDRRIGSIGDALIAASLLHAGAATIYSLDRRFPTDLGWQVVAP